MSHKRPILPLAVLLVLTACGDGGGGPVNPRPEPKQDKITASIQLGKSSFYPNELIDANIKSTVSNPSNLPIETYWRWNGQKAEFVSGRLNVTNVSAGNHTLAFVAQSPGTSVRDSAQVQVSVLAFPSVRLQVFSLDQSSISGLTATAFFGSDSLSTILSSTGAGTIQLLSVPNDMVRLRIDAVNTSARSYHPSLVKIAPGSLGTEVKIIMVPLQWTLTTGTYAGQVIPISVNTAYTLASTGNTSFYYRGLTWRDYENYYQIATWKFFPIPVAFDRSASNQTIAAEDPVSFWNIVSQMEQDFGQDLLKPAKRGEFEASQGVLVRVDTEYNPYGDNRGTLYSAVIPNATGDLHSGEIILTTKNNFTFTRGITHESLHILGFGHTCSWKSALFGGTPGCLVFSDKTTAHDAAYMQVMYKTRELMKQHNAPYGIPEALHGQRVYMLRLPPEFPPGN